jgi:uncharacterized membrane protein
VTKGRLEAFSDGVLAIIITIMVLELKAPQKAAGLGDLLPLLPGFVSYVISFVYVGIYWNNHHHLLHAARRVTAGAMWANLHLLFWLSLIPFATAWMGANDFAPVPTAAYGVVLLLAALAYYLLQAMILAEEGPESPLANALGRDLKGKLSPLLYLAAIPLALVSPLAANGLYVLVAVIWLVPDRRIERALAGGRQTEGGGPSVPR